jgi:hypothetical protein
MNKLSVFLFLLPLVGFAEHNRLTNIKSYIHHYVLVRVLLRTVYQLIIVHCIFKIIFNLLLYYLLVL